MLHLLIMMELNFSAQLCKENLTIVIYLKQIVSTDEYIENLKKGIIVVYIVYETYLAKLPTKE